jgi:hypothetical protein
MQPLVRGQGLARLVERLVHLGQEIERPRCFLRLRRGVHEAGELDAGPGPVARPEQRLGEVDLGLRIEVGRPGAGDGESVARPDDGPLLLGDGLARHPDQQLGGRRVAGESVDEAAGQRLHLRPRLVLHRDEEQGVEHARRGLRIAGAVEERGGEPLERAAALVARRAGVGRGQPGRVAIRQEHLALRAGMSVRGGEAVERRSGAHRRRAA